MLVRREGGAEISADQVSRGFIAHADEKLTAFLELEAVIFHGVNP
jgi:hypothetical protein